MKHNKTNKILKFIMKGKNLKIYQIVYRFPYFFISLLVAIAIIILYMFIDFILRYVIVI